MQVLAPFFQGRERRHSHVEYGLIASLIAIAAIGVFRAVGNNLVATFGDIADNLSSQ